MTFSLKKGLLALGLVAGLAMSATPARAIIVFGGDATGRNTTAPTDSGQLAAWNTEIAFAGGAGTVISSEYFVTAYHLRKANPSTGMNTTGTVNIGGTNYAVDFVANDNDLAIWKLDPSNNTTFDQLGVGIASLYTGQNEANKQLITFGYGTKKGAAVDYPQGTGNLVGWKWGGTDGKRSWGTNQVTSIVDVTNTPNFNGQYLAFNFDGNLTDPTAQANEGIFSNADSGGGTFINVNGTWLLAGVNSLVDGPFSYDANGPYFNAALFDARGFFVGSAGNHDFVDPTLPNPVPAASYAVRISSNLGFISDATGLVVPEPNSLVLLSIGLVGGLGVTAVRQRRGAGKTPEQARDGR